MWIRLERPSTGSFLTREIEVAKTPPGREEFAMYMEMYYPDWELIHSTTFNPDESA